ncbi:MAG: alkylmercury lyase family protein [Deinococcota bacterium]
MIPKELNHSSLHYSILKHIVDVGYAPSIKKLAGQFNTLETNVLAALKALQDYHGVVLHPHNSEVWVIHPFSLAPTNFLLRKGEMEWWGNCAWCSLGAAALLGGSVVITTTLANSSKQIRLHIQDGHLLDKDFYVHFPIPMTDVWNNVIFTCSTMLLFDDENEVEAWSTRHNIPRGDIQTVEKIFEFAKVWYGNHLNSEWQKWTLKESKAIFTQFELTHPVWHIPDSDGHF